MKNHEISRWRMHNQRLWGAPFHSAVGVVEGLLAIQAQEVGAARFSIGARAGVAESVVDAALAGGTILRTHVLRPTWHFVAARDLRWLLRLTAPRVRQLSAYQMKKLALDDKIIAKSNAILDKALTKTALSRDDVAAALVDGGVTDPTGLRLSYLLQEAELSALICSGPVQGKQQTWARVVDRVPDDDAVFAASSDDELLARLVGTFFATRGPATIKDCATWASLTTAMVKQGIEACNEGGNGKGKGKGKGEGQRQRQRQRRSSGRRQHGHRLLHARRPDAVACPRNVARFIRHPARRSRAGLRRDHSRIDRQSRGLL